MRIFSWNVNGLRSIMSKNFEGFLEEYSPDVLCLQETRMSPEALEKLGELPFKNALFSHSDKKGYSGTAIFTKKEPINVTYGMGIEEHDKAACKQYRRDGAVKAVGKQVRAAFSRL